MTVLETWYARVTIEALQEHFRKDPDMSARLSKKQKQARSRNSEAVFPKLTGVVDGRRKIKDDPPVIYHFHEFAPDFEKQRLKFTEEYKKSLQADRRSLFERYRFQDVAMKVVGVGSVGTRCYLSLLLADEDDPLFLQFKEARRSVLDRRAARAVMRTRDSEWWRVSMSCKPQATSFLVGSVTPKGMTITFASSAT